MPFNSETGSIAGNKGMKARWSKPRPPSSPTVRSKVFSVKVSPDELAMIDDKAKEYGLSRTEFIVRASRKY
jgi:hypothetical protein